MSSWRDVEASDSLAKLALDLACLHVDDTDIADDLALLASLFSELVKVRVALGKALEVLFLGCGVLEDRRHQRLCRDGCKALGQLGRGGDEAGENGQFASDIGTGKVVTRVGFLLLVGLACQTYGIAFVLGDLDDLAELDVSSFDLRKLVEDVAESAAKDTLNLFNLVAGSNQILERLQDGQAGADSRLAIVGRRTVGVSGSSDSVPEGNVTGSALLVGRNDMDSHL